MRLIETRVREERAIEVKEIRCDSSGVGVVLEGGGEIKARSRKRQANNRFDSSVIQHNMFTDHCHCPSFFPLTFGCNATKPSEKISSPHCGTGRLRVGLDCPLSVASPIASNKLALRALNH